MPPMDIKEWWLAAAAATSLVAPGAEAAISSGEQVGVVSATRPSVKSSATEKVVYVGEGVAFGERFKTDNSGIMHILFMDQSSITLGPNSEVTIDQFVYDPDKREGSLTVNLLKGALRVVGGFISKKTPTRITTPTATIGIRGGISLVDAQPQQTQAVFLFGQQMQVTTIGGGPQTLTRPGFGVTILGNVIGSPFLAPPSLLQGMSQLFVHPPGLGAPVAAKPSSGTTTGLISTSDRPSGGGNPAVGLANDRTQTINTNINTANPQNSLRNLLGDSPATNQS